MSSPLIAPFRIQPLSPLHATTIIRISGLFSPRKRGIGNDEERRRITGENRATSDDRATFADDLDDWTNRRYRKSIITGLKSPVVVSFSPSLPVRLLVIVTVISNYKFQAGVSFRLVGSLARSSSHFIDRRTPPLLLSLFYFFLPQRFCRSLDPLKLD